MAQLKTAVKSVTGAKVGLHDTTGTSLGDRWFLGLLKSVDPPVDYKALEGRKSVDTWAGLSRGGKIAASSALNCAFALVDKVALHDYSGGTEAEITTARAIDLATEALRKDLADIYALAGYGVPDPPDCLPDLVSAPSWQAAVASPSTGDPSSGIVRVYDATMCSGTEEDWYAFATGAINFQIPGAHHAAGDATGRWRKRDSTRSCASSRTGTRR